MPKEIMSFMVQRAGNVLVDATAGGGGHLALLAEACGPNGRVFAFDKDPRAHADDAAGLVAKRFSNVTLVHRPFSQIKETLTQYAVHQVDGLLCDLGVSSHQLDEESRGFSFLADGPIDMRMDTTARMSAYDWLATTPEDEIANVLYTYGGERKSRAIARAIKKSWPIENSTLALAKLVVSAMRQRTWSKAHPATRTFQAIRMAVNGEVEELEQLLSDLPSLLAPHGVAVFLSFHSVEDRMIKTAFKAMAAKREESEKTFALLNKKPIMASEEELKENRRARSAKLRAIVRLS